MHNNNKLACLCGAVTFVQITLSTSIADVWRFSGSISQGEEGREAGLEEQDTCLYTESGESCRAFTVLSITFGSMRGSSPWMLMTMSYSPGIFVIAS